MANVSKTISVTARKHGNASMKLYTMASKTLRDSNDNLSSKQNALNQMNIYFAEIGKNLTCQFNPVLIYEQPLNLNTPFKFMKVTNEQISLTVQSLNNTSATGVDNIPTSIVKTNFEYLNYTLKEIINDSLMTGTVPSAIKISKIVPI